MNTYTNESLNEKKQTINNNTKSKSGSGCIINTDNLHNQIIYIDTGFETHTKNESDISNSDIIGIGTD